MIKDSGWDQEVVCRCVTQTNIQLHVYIHQALLCECSKCWAITRLLPLPPELPNTEQTYNSGLLIVVWCVLKCVWCGRPASIDY